MPTDQELIAELRMAAQQVQHAYPVPTGNGPLDAYGIAAQPERILRLIECIEKLMGAQVVYEDNDKRMPTDQERIAEIEERIQGRANVTVYDLERILEEDPGDAPPTRDEDIQWCISQLKARDEEIDRLCQSGREVQKTAIRRGKEIARLKRERIELRGTLRAIRVICAGSESATERAIETQCAKALAYTGEPMPTGTDSIRAPMTLEEKSLVDVDDPDIEIG